MIHTVFSFPGRFCLDSFFLKFCNRLWFSRITNDFLSTITLVFDCLCNDFVGHTCLVPFIKDINLHCCIVYHQTHKCIWVSETKVKTKCSFDSWDCSDCINVKVFKSDFFIYQTFCNAPFTITFNSVSSWIVLLHLQEDVPVCFIQPFILFPGCCLCEDVIIYHIKEPGFQPGCCRPWIECQGYLLEISIRHFTTNGHIKFIEVIFIADFICFFNPYKAKNTIINRN